MKIDGEVLVDNWNETSPGEAFFSFATAPKRQSINLNKDQTYRFEVEYFFEGRFPSNSVRMQATRGSGSLAGSQKKPSQEADAVI